ncbi:alpha/beta hydrolase [Pseudarthrobacter sp. BRE9]|uniref:alpha/beta fold hydrolase n=1 Tax=Pseudarthrobacter sp. BRE9 TaxID=2962582 RepID=UPI002889BBA7|nr:alpha/beta hydrolase [Pseudarthrobacter sp. BRE9]
MIWGSHDNLLARSDQEELARRIAGAVLVVIPHAGHLVLWECPEQVAEETRAFLLNS